MSKFIVSTAAGSSGKLRAWKDNGQSGHITSILSGVALFWPWDGSGPELIYLSHLNSTPPDGQVSQL